MSIIDRPSTRLRASSTRTHAETAAAEPLGGRYVSAGTQQPRLEGSYVSTGTNNVAPTRGTFVTTSSPSPRAGGRYTYTS